MGSPCMALPKHVIVYFHFSLTEFSVAFQASSMSYNEAEPKDCKNVDDHLFFVQFRSR